jgi:hypothetical protein
MKESD